MQFSFACGFLVVGGCIAFISSLGVASKWEMTLTPLALALGLFGLAIAVASRRAP